MGMPNLQTLRQLNFSEVKVPAFLVALWWAYQTPPYPSAVDPIDDQKTTPNQRDEHF